MNCDIIMKLFKILVVFHLFVAVNTSRVQDAKAQIRDEVRHAIGGSRRPPSRKEMAEIRHDIGHHHTLDQPRKWSHRRRLGTYFTPWTKWSACDPQCRQSRERYCRKRRKCADTKHIEERKCYRCNPDHILPHPPVEVAHTTSTPHRIPVYEEIPKIEHDEPDYYVVKKYKKKRKPIVIEVEDYEDLENEQDEDDNDMFSKKFNRRQVKSIRTKEWNGDFHHFDPDVADIFDAIITSGRKAMPQDVSLEYEEDANIKDFAGLDENDMEYDYEYDEGKNSSRASHREKAVFELPPRHRRVYSRWSKWTKCSAKCTTRRYKKCRLREYCGKEVLREIAYCYTEGSFCQAWVESQVHKTPPYELKPVPMSRKDVVTTNSVSSDFVVSGKGYRGPEYAPLKLKCGIPSVRNSRRNTIDNMLKIIGGKSARKGQWPWQVVIFNRFKEAFCGGTLIAPNWVLTAAHCVRKVLYVRIGEHNLDVKDESEIEMRVVKSIKHPNYDKKTVDSDVALLRLPKPVAATQFVGYACLPKPYQPLPKNIQCTVIGWGKRRNRDQAGTSILHQAEVPIISMENCKAVYQDYTITKNMFCAGHKRGRIDTCAGDSGGPLLCRDSTQPNHPWTIFGITSFGDGCAKKNKFGIYAKVPNYVDWAWSVVNCNGNCKPIAANRKLG